MGGLQTGPALVRHDGNEEGVAIELSPIGARSLLGLPAVELTSHVVDLADLLGAAGLALPERLAATRDWPSRFRLLDEVLCCAARSQRAPRPPAEIAHAWHQLTAGKRFAVTDLAAEVGWSRRHFTEIFHREVGLPPRQFVRVLRFDRSAIALAQHPGDAARRIRSAPRILRPGAPVQGLAGAGRVLADRLGAARRAPFRPRRRFEYHATVNA